MDALSMGMRVLHVNNMSCRLVGLLAQEHVDRSNDTRIELSDFWQDFFVLLFLFWTKVTADLFGTILHFSMFKSP